MSTLFTDSFNRADGGWGANYTDAATAPSIVSNQAAPAATATATYYNGGNPGAACWVQVTAVTNVAPANYLGLGLRLSTSFNGYTCSWDTGGANIARIDAGAQTVLGSSFTPPGNGVVVRFEAHGSTLRLYYDNVLQQTRTDATYSTANPAWVIGQGTAARIDDLSLGTLPTLSAPTPSGTLGTSTTATIGCTTDDTGGGTLYVVVDQGSLAAVTAAQIIAGQDAGGAAADASGSATVASATPSVGVTGLLASTTYNYALLQIRGGNSNIVTGSFTTAAGSSPTISSTSSASPLNGASMTVNGTNFGASQGTGGVTIGGTAVVETSWSATAVPVTVDIGNNKFGAPLNVVLTDNGGTPSNSYALTSILPASGNGYVDLGTLNTTAAFRITAIADLVSGNQLEHTNAALVTLYSDGTFSADASVTSFQVRAWDNATDGWGAWATQTLADAWARRRTKVWNGTAWVERALERHDGTAWRQAPCKVLAS